VPRRACGTSPGFLQPDLCGQPTRGHVGQQSVAGQPEVKLSPVWGQPEVASRRNRGGRPPTKQTSPKAKTTNGLPRPMGAPGLLGVASLRHARGAGHKLMQTALGGSRCGVGALTALGQERSLSTRAKNPENKSTSIALPSCFLVSSLGGFSLGPAESQTPRPCTPKTAHAMPTSSPSCQRR
jgi:hypothetical protein